MFRHWSRKMFSLLLLICAFIILKVCECNWPCIRTINAPASSTSTRVIEIIVPATTSLGIAIWFAVTVDFFQQKIWCRLLWYFNWEHVFLPDWTTPCCWIHVSDSLVKKILTLKINVQRVKLCSIWSRWKWLDLDANYTTDGHYFWCKLPPTTQIKSFQWKSTIQRPLLQPWLLLALTYFQPWKLLLAHEDMDRTSIVFSAHCLPIPNNQLVSHPVMEWIKGAR